MKRRPSAGDDVSAGGLLEEDRLAADAAKGAYRRIHAARDVPAGFLIQTHHLSPLRSQRRGRQVEPHLEAAACAVVGPCRPAVRFHDLGGDGQTDALAAGVAIAGFGHAVKGLEDALELARGNTRSPIANRRS